MSPHNMVTLDYRHLRLMGRLFLPAIGERYRRRPAVLFVHGWASSQDANDVVLAGDLAKEGFVCLTFDLAGHGLSQGDRTAFTAEDFLDQLILAYDWLAARPEVDPALISVCGASLGGYLSLVLTAERPVANVSLRVPANYPDEVFATVTVNDYFLSEEAKAWNAEPLDAEATRSTRALAAFDGGIQMIEAGADEVIDPQTIANYLAAAQPLAMVDYAILPGAPHILHQSPRARHEVRQRMRAWMVTQLEMVWCQRRTGALIVQNASALW